MHAIFSAVAAVPSALCRELISCFEAAHDPMQSHDFAATEKYVRSGLVVTMNGSDKWVQLRNRVYDCVKPALGLAAAQNPGLKAMLNEKHIYTIPRIERTSPGDGFKWHVDALHQDARFVTVLCYLNDVLEGGQTEFLKQEILVQPSEGSILLFPPFWTHVHRGHPPVGQNKYTLGFFVAATDDGSSELRKSADFCS